jgi:hypothetical protein
MELHPHALALVGVRRQQFGGLIVPTLLRQHERALCLRPAREACRDGRCHLQGLNETAGLRERLDRALERGDLRGR